MSSRTVVKSTHFTLPRNFDREQPQKCTLDGKLYKNFASLYTHWKKFHATERCDLSMLNRDVDADDDDKNVDEAESVSDDQVENPKQPPSPLEKLVSVAVEEKNHDANMNEARVRIVPVTMQAYINYMVFRIENVDKEMRERGARDLADIRTLSDEELENDLQREMRETRTVVAIGEDCDNTVKRHDELIDSLRRVFQIAELTRLRCEGEIGRLVVEKDNRAQKRKREEE